MLNKGILAAIVTPFDPSGKLDEDQLRMLVGHLLNQGIEGFYVCGTTGESFLMDEAERMRVLEIVSEENAGRASLVCHCGAISTEHTLRLARHAKQVGVDAISAIPPFYYKFSAEELVAHYRALASATDLPVIIYNFPALSGVQFSNQTWDALLTLPNVCAVKHTSYDLYQLERIKQRYPHITFFNGHEEMLLSGLAAGANGAIGSTFNAVPKAALKIRDCYKANDYAGAIQAQHFLNDFIDLLGRYGTMQTIKSFLSHYGITSCYVRAPFMQISEEGAKAAAAMYERYRKEFDL